jgi:hypothetical protein
MKSEIPTPSHDLAVCYRIYPGLSGKPAFGITDKLAMVRLNLRSFKAALGNLKVKMWVILDQCPPAYQELVTAAFAGTDLEIIALEKKEGNAGTFLRQLEVLCSQTAAHLVYFAEDDYLYLPDALAMAVAFMRRHPEADYSTPSDHADFDTKYIHRFRGIERHAEGRRWRTVASTCLTFMARHTALVENRAVFATYARRNSDLGLWLALTKNRVVNPWCFFRSLGDGLFFPASQALAWRHAWRNILFGPRRTLWVPRPSLATHLESTDLAPHVEWEQYLPKFTEAGKTSSFQKE